MLREIYDTISPLYSVKSVPGTAFLSIPPSLSLGTVGGETISDGAVAGIIIGVVGTLFDGSVSLNLMLLLNEYV